MSLEILPLDDKRFASERVLQSSLFGTVCLARDTSNSRTVALKSSSLSQNLLARATENPYREVRLLEWLTRQNNGQGHRNVVRLLAVLCDKYAPLESWDAEHDFESPASDELTCVLEYMDKGELFTMISEQGAFGEQRARRYFGQVADGVAWLHSLGVCHLDLTLENLLLNGQDDCVKIIDFGVARRVKYVQTNHAFAEPATAKNTPQTSASEQLGVQIAPLEYKEEPRRVEKEKFRGKPGKLAYQAPELFDGAAVDGCACDVFSLGVLLFVMLTGVPPFLSASRTDVRFTNMLEGRAPGIRKLLTAWKFPHISDNAVDLLSRTICAEGDRLTIEQVLKHPWLGA